MKKKIIALIISSYMVFSTPIVAGAETLEERITALEARVAELEALVGVEDTDEIETEYITEVETETEEAVLMDTQEFLDDIVASYNARGVVAERYTNAELNTMSNDEYVDFRSDIVETERDFYEKYKNATFKDLNIQYLCKTYCYGVKNQIECCERYSEEKDYTAWSDTWTAAYNKRSYVIVELAEYYDAPFSDIEEMKANTELLDSLNEAETRNASVDHVTVQKTQDLLNEIGFFCGNADGVSGKRTVKSIKRFQEMYGYDPVDGMIDEELIKQLENELAKK